MDQKTWQQALDVYDTYGDLSIEEFTTQINKLSLTRELRDLLIDLKKTEDDASDYFDKLEGEVTEFMDPPMPEKLGPWSVKELIETGGMSSVYLAERDDDQYRMKAAAKFIHFAGYNPVVIQRFKREMQFLALLDHPNITRIIDSGVTDHGMPWYIMEYVEGLPITEYCDKHKLNLEQRLQLFLQVCDTVQHAHKNLVIHRDLKPTNIFVDTEGNVKLLDFGIAKAFSPDTPEQMLTQDNQMLMTPAYASPEQLEGSPVNTTSDVYSLGVILHQLLTGKHPYTFKKLSPVKMVNRIRQSPPDRPSATFKNADPKPAGINHATLSRELDDILLTALRAEPDRRYASAEQLGRDLKNFLNNEPVMARADSRKYRVQKFVQRNKTAVALSALSLIILFTSMFAIVWQAGVIASERDIAQTEAALSDAVREHLMFLFREAGSLADDTDQVSARELLDRSARVAEDWLQDDPEIQRQVLAVLGEIMLALNDYSAAETLLEKVIATEPDNDNPFLRAIIYRDMAQVHHRRGNLNEGFALVDEAVKLIENVPGDHRVRLSDILQIRGRLHRDLGRQDAAIADLERARVLAEETSSIPRPLHARASSNLGTTLLVYGDLKSAKVHFERAEEIWQQLGRPESTEALSVMNNLAVVYNHLGQPAEAKNMFRKVVDLRLKNYGESGSLAAALLHLGRILVTYGELDEAAKMLRYSEEMAARFVGESSPSHAASFIGLGELYRALGDHETAYTHFETANTMFLDNFGPMHPHTLLSDSELVNTLRDKDGSVSHNRYADLIERADEMGPAANMVLSGVHCQAVRNAINLEDYELAKSHAIKCRQQRNDLGLNGWRLIEANALIELTETMIGTPLARRKLMTEIDHFSELVSEHHPGLTWIVLQANSLGNSL